MGLVKNKCHLNLQKKNNKPLLTGIIASRLDPQKGQDLAIEALERLQKEGLFFNLLIMGDNTRNEQDFRAHLLELIHQKGLEDYVILIPFSESILDYIAGSDFLLMPSWQETFGRVIPEAMTLGVTCIASDKGGVPDLIFDGKNGFLFKSRDLSDLTRVLKEIINDPSALKKVALQGLKDSKQFKSEKILNELLKIFKIDPSPTHRPTHRLHRDHQIEASNPTLF